MKMSAKEVIFTLIITGLGILLANFIGFHVAFIDSLPGVGVLLAIALADHKSSLGKFKKTEIISSIFSDHNVVRSGINYRKKKLLKRKTYGWNTSPIWMPI